MPAPMTSHGSKRYPKHHGYGEVRASRYYALYMTQIGWLVLGLFLYRTAFWPSSCTPETVWEVVTCSIRLPESGGWTEAALLTWLWSTPLLIGLEISRRLNKGEE
jgi:hypothetical protein